MMMLRVSDLELKRNKLKICNLKNYEVIPDRCEWPEIADCRLSGETTTASDGQTTTVELEVTIVTDDGETTSNSYDPRCPLINDPLNVIHLPHEYDCSLFYKCDWGRAVLQNCPEYLHWSISADRCEWPEIADCRLSGETTTASDGQTTTVELEVTIVTDDGETISNICDPRCPLRNEEGSKVVHLPHEFDCTLFYKCDWCRAILHECPAGLYFDPFLSVCNYPEEVACRFVAI
ncbi:CLUMA_CG012346, isoform A [Clunio marinus]|uniref:CLUMA_CG012346, isoform A n=1 Tax=Clunio marinus TaxID=568069 RepID=A0A1J1IFK5_9DIPT|nr:CLUMA_CG012346, isoform A [Clunio marinus]